MKKKCRCKQLNKNCTMTGKLDLDNFNDTTYIEKLYDENILDSLYNIMQSITQSLRTSCGNEFETLIENCFKMKSLKNGIHYKSQVYKDGILYDKILNNGGHTIDFIFPCPKKFPIKLKK